VKRVNLKGTEQPFGIYKGRKPSIDVANGREMQSSGLGASAIGKPLGISRASVYPSLG
jgi:hypothetical protein